MPYFVYLLRCKDNTLYCGITTNLERRVKEHNSGSVKAAKYTRNKAPVTLVYYEEFKDRSLASKREWKIKQLSKEEKEIIITSFKNTS